MSKSLVGHMNAQGTRSNRLEPMSDHGTDTSMPVGVAFDGGTGRLCCNISSTQTCSAALMYSSREETAVRHALSCCERAQHHAHRCTPCCCVPAWLREEGCVVASATTLARANDPNKLWHLHGTLCSAMYGECSVRGARNEAASALEHLEKSEEKCSRFVLFQRLT